MYDIYLKNITLIKNDRKILDNISAHFPMGKTTVILGPSGCGKSSLLKAASALMPINSGEISVNNRDLTKMSVLDLLEYRKNSSFVFQDGALWANKSVYQNMSLPLNLHYPEMNIDKHDAVIMELLNKVGYSDSIHLRPAALSNGERKMVSLARALITTPKLIYMDSPLVLVDPSVAKKMRKLIIDLHETSATIIGIFSSPALISKIADYLVVMEDGKIIETGTLETMENSKNPVTSSIIDSLLRLS